MDNIKQIFPFALRNLKYAGDGDSTRFTATLAAGSISVAEISGEHFPDSQTSEAKARACIEASVVNPHFWTQFELYASTTQAVVQEDEACASPTVVLLLKMANDAYHARRLQVMSLRHTAYRLTGDAPGQFHFLRNRPYSIETEGQLRLTYGRRLEFVFRRGEGAEAIAAA